MLFRKRNGASRGSVVPPASSRGALEVPGGGTVIGAGTRFQGTVKGAGPVVVRGIVLGEIDLRGGLTVTTTGRVDADVEVQNVELSGEARGTMRASGRVVLGPSGLFEGDIATPVIEMHPGSVLRGRASVAGAPIARRRDLSH